MVFQLSTSALVAALSSPAAAASTWPRVALTTGMKALQLHQVSSATKVISRALRVRGQKTGLNSSLMRGGACALRACRPSGPVP